MAFKLRAYLKSKFNTGSRPTKDDFGDLIDTLLGIVGFSSAAGDFQFNNTETDLGLSYTVPEGMSGKLKVEICAQIGFEDNTAYSSGRVSLKKNGTNISGSGQSVSNQITNDGNANVQSLSFFEYFDVVAGDIITAYGINDVNSNLVDCPKRKMFCTLYLK